MKNHEQWWIAHVLVIFKKVQREWLIEESWIGAGFKIVDEINNSGGADVLVATVCCRCWNNAIAVTVTPSQLFTWAHTHAHTDIFWALIMVCCRLTSIFLPPAGLRFSQCQTPLLSCWEKLSVSFQHSFASFSLIYHGESSCLPS